AGFSLLCRHHPSTKEIQIDILAVDVGGSDHEQRRLSRSSSWDDTDSTSRHENPRQGRRTHLPDLRNPRRFKPKKFGARALIGSSLSNQL
ncbi:hypothetical protein LINPERHAP1_LOCUS32654, partial [Linum perenne]